MTSMVPLPSILLTHWLVELSEIELRVLLYAIWRVYQAGQSPVAISLGEMTNGQADEQDTGTGIGRKSSYSAVATLERRGLLIVERRMRSDGGNDTTLYSLPDTWPAAPIRKPTLKLKDLLLDRDGPGCQYCGTTTATHYHIDHIVPTAMGGPTSLYNLVLACKACNTHKNGRVWTPRNLETVITTRPTWRTRILSETTGP